MGHWLSATRPCYGRPLLTKGLVTHELVISQSRQVYNYKNCAYHISFNASSHDAFFARHIPRASRIHYPAGPLRCQTRRLKPNQKRRRRPSCMKPLLSKRSYVATPWSLTTVGNKDLTTMRAEFKFSLMPRDVLPGSKGGVAIFFHQRQRTRFHPYCANQNL